MNEQLLKVLGLPVIHRNLGVELQGVFAADRIRLPDQAKVLMISPQPIKVDILLQKILQSFNIELTEVYYIALADSALVDNPPLWVWLCGCGNAVKTVQVNYAATPINWLITEQLEQVQTSQSARRELWEQIKDGRNRH